MTTTIQNQLEGSLSTELALAMEKHGHDIVEVMLTEPFMNWPISQAMGAMAILARDVAKAEKERRLLDKSK